MKRARYVTPLLPCILLVLLSGCAAPLKKGIYLAPDFQPGAVSEINLLPPIDARIDKEVEVDLEKQLRGEIRSMLKRRGYKVSDSDRVDNMEQLTEDELKSALPGLIRRLGPPGARHVMVVLLLDVKTKFTFGSTGTAEVAGFIYDKESEKLIWRDKGIGKAGQGGLIGMAMKGMMDEQAISMANRNLVASIPKRSD